MGKKKRGTSKAKKSAGRASGAVKVPKRKPTRRPAKAAGTSKNNASKSPAKAAAAKSRASKINDKFNLLVSFNPNHARTAKAELIQVLQKIGESPRIAETGAEGLFKVVVSDGRKVVSRLRKLCSADPNLFTATHRFTPVDRWCKSTVSQMQKLIKSASAGIASTDKWKLGLTKRHWNKLEGSKLIIKLTDVINHEHVDLESPQKVIQVDIIGDQAGISLLNPEDLLDAGEAKQET